MEIHSKLLRLFNRSESTEGSPMLCIGHSHLRCVQAAADVEQVPIHAINFWDDNSIVLGYPENPTLVPAVQRRFRAYTGTVFSFIAGSAHTVVGLLSHPRRFDFVLPEGPQLPVNPEAEVIPVDAVRAILLEQLSPYFKMMRHVRSLTRGRMVHMEPPAPCGDEKRLRRCVPWPLFPGMLREIAPRPSRYKLWRLHSTILSEFCAEHDIEFASHPPQSVDEEGFLRSEFFQDGIHANEQYGKLLLQQMQDLV